MSLKNGIAGARKSLLALSFLLLPVVAFAQQTERGGESLGAALLRTGAALLFILGLFFLFVYLMKRFFPGAFVANLPATKDNESRQIKLLSTKQLGPKRYLHVVRVGSREYLIGAGDQGFSRLGEWEAVDDSPSEPEADGESNESS